MSELESRFVKEGYWVNLSQGRVMGQTITTDAKSGAIVVALLAVITSLGMTHLWHLLTFIFHQSRANGRPRDGLFRHQQAILRTLPTPSSMMADSVMLWYAWRGVSERALGRSLAQISIAFLFAAASLVASIYSSWIVENSNLEVLVQSPHCGSPNISTAIGNFHSFLNPISAAAEEYAMACYKKNGSLPSRCNIFSRPTVDSTTTEVPCPFDDKMCASPAIALDSGLVDVNVAFGLNLGDADRILYQRKTTCAILPLEGYTKVTTVSSDRSTPPSSGQGQLTEYLYGVSDFGIRDPSSPGDDIMVLSTKETLSMNGFDKRELSTYAKWHSGYEVIPELSRKDGDVSILLVIKKMRYLTPVDDPLFSAHRRVDVLISSLTNTTRSEYTSDDMATGIACLAQTQYCLGDGTCTGLEGSSSDNSQIKLPGATPTQTSLLKTLMLANNFGTFTEAQGFITNQYNMGDNDVIHSLPDDQWIKELEYWDSYAWAFHQIFITDHAIGPTVRAPLSEPFIIPAEGAELKLCNMQKMRKQGGFSNINFFGLVFTFVVASTIIILDLALLRFLEYFSRYKHGLAPRINRWVQDGVFQLIRRAHDAQGHGVWKGLSHDVPITAEKCLLPDLELDTLIVVPSTPSTPVTFISKHRSSSVNSTPEQILKPHMTTMSEKTLAGDDEMDLEVTFKLDQGPSWEEGGQVAQEKQQQDNWFWKSGKDYGFDDITPIEDVNREWLGSSRDGSS